MQCNKEIQNSLTSTYIFGLGQQVKKILIPYKFSKHCHSCAGTGQTCISCTSPAPDPAWPRPQCWTLARWSPGWSAAWCPPASSGTWARWEFWRTWGLSWWRGWGQEPTGWKVDAGAPPGWWWRCRSSPGRWRQRSTESAIQWSSWRTSTLTWLLTWVLPASTMFFHMGAIEPLSRF